MKKENKMKKEKTPKKNLREIKEKESKNEKAKEIVGLRHNGKCGIIFDFPVELGYHCPVCKYKTVIKGNFDERLEWSEYNGFIWCSVCNKDYPSAFCMPDMDRAIDIYLDCVKEAKKSYQNN